MSYKAGIYSIYCTANEKQYIGSSKDIAKRWQDHRSDLRNNRHGCHHLQRAWNKYGEAAFVFNVIEHIIDPLISAKQLTDIEQIWIDAYWDQRLLFNGRPKAESTLGLSPPNKGKKGLQVAWNKGKKGSVPWNKGKVGEYKLPPHSEAARLKASESNIGKHVSEETRLKLVEAWKTRPPITQETRDKLSISVKDSWNKRRRTLTEAQKQALRGKRGPHKNKRKSATPDSTE